MGNPESPRSVESVQQKLDALVVPGKDIGVRNSPKQIRAKQNRLTELGMVGSALSLETGLNVIATGKLFKQGIAEKIIFTTGHTAGDDIRSEAQAMRDLLREVYPEIPDSVIILEEESKSTGGNAEKVSKIIKQHNFERVGIVDVGFHLPDVVMLLRRYGVNVKDEDTFVAEKIVSQEAKDPTLFPLHYNSSSVVEAEITREGIKNIVYIFDRKARILEWVAQKTRK